MKLTKKLLAAVGLVYGLGVVLLSTTLAIAAPSPGTLATNEQAFVFSYDVNDTKPNLFSIDSKSATTTAIGTTGPLTGESVYWTNAAFNPITKTSYAVASRGSSPNFYSTLFSVDTSNGQFTKVADIKAGETAINAFGFTIDRDGNAFVTTNAAGTISLHSLNLTTGAASLIKVLEGTTGTSYSSLASDPVTNKLFLSLTENDSSNNTLGSRIFEINQSSGAVTASSLFSGANGSTPKPIVGMQFDVNGTLWFLYGDGYGNTTELWSADAANFPSSAVKSADLNGARTEAIALLLVSNSTPNPGPGPNPSPASELAATGVNGNIFGAISFSLVGAGLGLLIMFRRRAS